jgi:hypothetical protein
MAFKDMTFELTGERAMPFDLVKTKINEALGYIYDEQLWSFQFGENGWLTPGLLFASNNQSTGTITATAFSNQIVGDATAAAAWVAYQVAGTKPLLTQVQIRSPYYSLYNIVSFDGVNTFTLDRVWMEPSGTGLGYMIYQAYFPVPVSDFKRFFEIRDTTMAAPLDFWSFDRRDLALRDPQRTNFDLPAFVVPYEPDTRSGSTTLGNMLYELWPHPLSSLPYTFSYLHRGTLLSSPSDTLVYPLTEEMVKWRAREVAYIFKESQKGEGVQRGAGADWKFLAQSAAAEYKRTKKVVADRDRDMIDLYWTRFVRDMTIASNDDGFATINAQVNLGRM